ncbi:MAG: transketolase [Actinobacteria bacterium]|nr:MAG: transketolase [Actinomycetota bacterium]
MHSELVEKATKIRQDIIKMIGLAGSGHPGGSLSCADILCALYFKILYVDPKNPKMKNRDRFVLSKGHACPALYAVLAEASFFPREKLWTLRKLGSSLQGHPDLRRTVGIDMSSGSLGLGISTAVGMAMAGKMDGEDHHVYSIIGDGESQEGIIWESAIFAAHHKLDNLIVFLDNNGLQIDGKTCDISSLEPIAQKWEAFGWQTFEVDGHDFNQIIEAADKAKKVKEKPSMIVAHTVKGKGVSFMENKVDWHGVAPNKEQVRQALLELGVSEDELDE